MHDEQPVAKEDGESAVSFQSSAVEASSTASTGLERAVPRLDIAMAGKGGTEVTADAQAEAPQAPAAPAGDAAADEGSASESDASEPAGQGGDAAASAETELPAAYVLEKTNPAVRAVMEGTASHENGTWRFTGRWRLRWPDPLTSEFEWSSAAATGTAERPCAGNYEGFFHMLTPQGQCRYEETELRLNFAENAEGGFNVEGDGKNYFGLFGIRGLVLSDRKFQMVKLVTDPLLGGAGNVDRTSWVQQALDLVRYATSTPRSKWFRQPVAATVCVNRGHEAIWYSDVIKTPMDFQTLRDNLKAQRYTALSQFVTAARLIFTNAWTFNREGDACYDDADFVCSRFERRLAEITGDEMPQFMQAVDARLEAASAKGRQKAKEGRAPPGRKRAPGGRVAAAKGRAKRAKLTEDSAGASEGDEIPRAKAGKGDGEGGDELKDRLNKAKSEVAMLKEQVRELAPPRRGRGAGRGPKRKEKAEDAGQEGGGGGRGRGGGGRGGGRRGAQAGRGAAAAKAGKPKVESNDDRPLTEAEKELLQQRIDALNEDHLDAVLDFLSGDLDGNGSANEEAELDIDSLEPSRQRELVRLVEAQLRKMGPAASA